MAACTVSSLTLAAPVRRAQVQQTAGPRPGLVTLPRSAIPRVHKKFVVRAQTSETKEAEAPDVDAMVKDLQAKWDAVENKTSVAVYGAGALVVIWLSSTIVSAVNAVPLLPKFLELVGLGYSAWFVYRYLLFKSSREELIDDVEELKKKITGTDK